MRLFYDMARKLLSFMKIFHVDIAALMLDPLKVAGEAKNFVIIGYGMRPKSDESGGSILIPPRN